MGLLFSRVPNLITTESVVTVAAGNWRIGREMMGLLFSRVPNLTITESVVTAAAGNAQSGREVMELLLAKVPNLIITESVVTAAAGNTNCSEEVMQLLLGKDLISVKLSSLSAAAFFDQKKWFQILWAKIDVDSSFPQNNRQCLSAAIEGCDQMILDTCLSSTLNFDGTDGHGWTLHMVCVQSGNKTAIEKIGTAWETPMQVTSKICWELKPIVSGFVRIDDDGASLVYLGTLSSFTSDF
jgi:hypothetical protein